MSPGSQVAYHRAMGPDDDAVAARQADNTVDYLALDDKALLAKCQVDTYRASGPGGQKRNKTDSAVRLRLPAAGLAVIATESRSQHEIRARALRRMRGRIALELRRRIDPEAYRPSELLAACLNRRSQLVVGKRDLRYPQVVREVLDLLAAGGCRVSAAAERIGLTTGALTTFLRRDVGLLSRVNRMRRQAGLKAIR